MLWQFINWQKQLRIRKLIKLKIYIWERAHSTLQKTKGAADWLPPLFLRALYHLLSLTMWTQLFLNLVSFLISSIRAMAFSKSFSPSM